MHINQASENIKIAKQ